MPGADASVAPPLAEAVPVADGPLMTALVGGDRQALASLHDRHAAVLLGLAARLLRDRARAEEVVHDVFLEAWHQARDYDPSRGSVRAWLVTRTRARGLERRADSASAGPVAEQRAAEARDRRGLDAGVTGPARPDTGPAPLDAAPTSVREEAQPLARDLATVLEMAYFDGLSFAEIGEALHVPLGTVKARMARALSAVREGMGLPRTTKSANQDVVNSDTTQGAP